MKESGGRSNRIKSLKRDDGSIAVKQEELEEVATSFYRGLFTAQENLDVGAILQHVQPKVTVAMNDSLTLRRSGELCS